MNRDSAVTAESHEDEIHRGNLTRENVRKTLGSLPGMIGVFASAELISSHLSI